MGARVGETARGSQCGGGKGGLDPEPDAQDGRKEIAKPNAEEGANREYIAIVHGIKIRVIGMDFAALWLNSLARVVEAIPHGLRKEIEFILCCRDGDEDWPPCVTGRGIPVISFARTRL